MKSEFYALGYYGFDGAFHVKCSGSKYYVNKKLCQQEKKKNK